MTDFSKPIDLNKPIITTFKNKSLILNNLFFYDGPITRQLLPYGGIQGVNDYLLIINCKNGFIASNDLIYDNNKMSSKEFILMFEDVVNEVLPN